MTEKATRKPFCLIILLKAHPAARKLRYWNESEANFIFDEKLCQRIPQAPSSSTFVSIMAEAFGLPLKSRRNICKV
jgi:hypothetical protein